MKRPCCNHSAASKAKAALAAIKGKRRLCSGPNGSMSPPCQPLEIKRVF